MNKIVLTEHQNEKLNNILFLLKSSNVIKIRGSAGVGKTTLVNELIKNIDTNKLIYCSAPTNKAVAVLQSKVTPLKNIEFITIHSALKMKRVIDFKTGDISFKSTTNNELTILKDVDVLIIDEASMLNSYLLEIIENNTRNRKVIYIFDEKQLNPVNEDISPIVLKNYPEVVLTEIVRQQANNPIIELSNELNKINELQEKTNDTGGFVYTYDEQKIIQQLSNVNGTNELKYLAYTNKEVDDMNKKVRTHLYQTPDKIELYETLIFNSPYKEIYYTNQEIKVNNLQLVSKKFYYKERTTLYNVELKCYLINDSIYTVHEESDFYYNHIIKDLLNKCKKGYANWKDYYDFIENFADLKYNHAISVHKSQGSSYEKVIINIKDININRNNAEKQRLLYTAVTRASNLVILYNV